MELATEIEHAEELVDQLHRHGNLPDLKATALFERADADDARIRVDVHAAQSQHLGDASARSRKRLQEQTLLCAQDRGCGQNPLAFRTCEILPLTVGAVEARRPLVIATNSR